MFCEDAVEEAVEEGDGADDEGDGEGEGEEDEGHERLLVIRAWASRRRVSHMAGVMARRMWAMIACRTKAE